MSDEIQRGGSPGEEKDGGADGRGPTRPVSRETGQRPARKSSVYLYLLILFGAAFLMLLLAYFVQQRNNESTISGLQDSWNLSRGELVDSIEQLTEEKTLLEAQVAQLKEELKQAEETAQEFETLHDGATDAVSHLEYYLNKRSEAMELFWQLDKAYTQGKNQRCRDLMALLEAPEAEPLKSYLPDVTDRDGYDNGGYLEDWPSPAQRYQEIYEKLAG